MAKHECPDCGASHEMSTAGRIAKLEERVRELEARQLVCPHPHYWYHPVYPTTVPTWTWTSNGTAANPYSGVTIYNSSSGNYPELT